MKFRAVIIFTWLFLFFSFFAVEAQELTSTSYRISNPALFSGGLSTSTNFSLLSAISQFAVGTSTSAGFGLNPGFLYFPFVSTPAVSAAGGDAKVDLTWTSADASTGWAVGGYSVGQATVAGGPYTFTNVGNVLSSSRTGLTNGTQYFFVVQVLDALNNTIATSTEVSATPAAAGGGGEGGGGGGGGNTGVVFSGRAYPLSRVTILKDGQVAVTTIAGADSKFKVTFSSLSSGDYLFSVYSEDVNRVRSSPFSFPVSLTAGAMVEVSGIFLAPTISVDKLEVRQGDTISIFGQSAPSSEIIVNVNSEQEFFVRQESDENGIYLLNFDTSELEKGQHSAKSKSVVLNEISSFSKTAGFVVGTRNVLAALVAACPARADVNGDCRVNIVDFSMVAYWYGRGIPPANVDISGDRKIDLIDFSIMASYWTG